MPEIIKKIIFTGFILLSVYSVSVLAASPLRSFDDLFPYIDAGRKQDVFRGTGLRNTFLARETPMFTPALNSGIDLINTIMEKSPSTLIEALFVLPYSGRSFTLLDTYNAVGRVETLSSHIIYSPSRDRDVAFFLESSRFERGDRNRSIPDPPPAATIPSSETIYFRIKDIVFGNTYFRGDFSVGDYGITYILTNHATVWFLVFPVMRAEKFAMRLYMEPIAEGLLIYGIAGIDVPEFLVTRINLSASIDVRVRIVISWLRDNLIALN